MKSSMIILALLLNTCFPPIRFDVAQPEGQRNLKRMPREIRGVYQVVHDTAYTPNFQYEFEQLTISEKEIIFILEVSSKVLAADVDIESDLGWDGVDTVEYCKNGSVIKWNVINDSIEMIGHAHDTIFSFRKKDILREYKGYYFMNRTDSSDTWVVQFIKQTDKGLNYGQTDDLFDFVLFNHISSSTYSKATNTFHPSKEQLIEFIDKNGFQFRSQYRKVNKETQRLPKHPELCKPPYVPAYTVNQ